MKYFKTKTRLLLCGVIIAAFFLPAFEGISGFLFVRLAFSEVGSHSEITQTDVLLAIIPLLLVPLSSLAILLASSLHLTIRKIYLIFPLAFMFSFFGLLVLTARNNSGAFASPTVFLNMQPGFYIAGLASTLLIFSKDLKKKKRRKRVATPDMPATA
jgi:hypothetical protein